MKATEATVHIPKLVSIDRAIELYYSSVELQNDDIRELFGPIGKAKIAQLKKVAEDARRDIGLFRWSAYGVNTVAAYQAWHIDISELEAKYEHLTRHQIRRAKAEREIGRTAG